jgi:RNA polymerase sigma-70 factor (ECF subfamily)
MGPTVQQESLLSDRAPRERLSEFDRVFRSERAVVQRHLVRLTGDSSLAEDLGQEAFSRLYQRMLAEDDEPLRNVRAWLLTVASNLAYNHFRSETRRDARELAVTSAPGEADLDAALDVREALARLDVRDRFVLLLRHSGFTYAEIAEATGLASGSIGTTLARAQRRFRATYEGDPSAARDKE